MPLDVFPPAPVGAVDTTASGNVDMGFHSYAVTFVGPWGESTPGTPLSVYCSHAATCAISGVPLGPADATGRNIYRTPATSSYAYGLVGAINDNTTTTYSDTTADANLAGSPAQFAVNGGDLSGQFLLFDVLPPVGTANYGVLNLGPGPWDGISTGYFRGASAGTLIAADLPASNANFIDLQRAGVSKFLVDRSGNGQFAGGLSTAVTTTTVSTSLFSSDSVVIVNSAGLTITLPAANTLPAGRVYTVKNGAAGTSTIVRTSGGTIDGATSDATLSAAYASAQYITDGSNWFKI